MALLKGKEMVFKGFEGGIFSKIKESEQSEQSSHDVIYNSCGYYAYKLTKKLKDLSLEIISSDTDNTDNKLFTPIKKEQELKY